MMTDSEFFDQAFLAILSKSGGEGAYLTSDLIAFSTPQWVTDDGYVVELADMALEQRNARHIAAGVMSGG